MRELILLARADADIQAAFNRYESYQDGRGEAFLLHLDAALGLIRRFPEAGPIYRGVYRRVLLNDFPFGVFYQLQPTRIVVVGVVDPRRPKAIRSRFGAPMS